MHVFDWTTCAWLQPLRFPEMCSHMQQDSSLVFAEALVISETILNDYVHIYKQKTFNERVEKGPRRAALATQPHGGRTCTFPRCPQPCHLPRPSRRHQLSNDILFSKNNVILHPVCPLDASATATMKAASQSRPISYPQSQTKLLSYSAHPFQ